MQQNSTDALKEKLYKAQQQRDEALEELSDLQVKHQKLVSFIEEKAKKIYEADLRNVQNDKDVVDLFVETLQEIISLNKELQSEDECDDDEQEEEQGEKGETSGKAGDVDDSDDDDSDDDEEEEGQEGNRSGKDDDVDESDKDQEEEGDEDEEDGGGKGGGKGGDNQQDEEEGGGKGGDIHDDDLQGGKGGDMRGDETDKEGSKGGDDEGGKSEKRSTPLSNTNEEKDGKDGTRQGVESETAKKPRTSLPETAAYKDATETAEIDEATIIAAEAISQLDPKGMLSVEEDLLLLTRMAASDVKEKMATVIHECPNFQLLSQEDPQEESSQRSLSNDDVRERIVAEAVQFIQQHGDAFFSSQEV
ncbi:centromere-binding protein 1-like [Papaver somniferum]|uniref:centromere-binding protein 1-like n=1 Tax=Papaver somniferum TaxID=3469 RepID=UPI000E6F6765|nr:centromere-binding protein 1-like [Papaver somniferum]